MPWRDLAVFFFGGVFLANFVPHFVTGVCGRSFPSPLARPPFRGLSSPAVNVLWGLFNLEVAYALLVVIGRIDLLRVGHVALFAAGLALASVGLARKLGRLQGGSP